MRNYRKPEFQVIRYIVEEVLTDSQNSVNTNGEHNIEFDYQPWDDDII